VPLNILNEKAFNIPGRKETSTQSCKDKEAAQEAEENYLHLNEKSLKTLIYKWAKEWHEISHQRKFQ
jgi:hypothetical protein